MLTVAALVGAAVVAPMSAATADPPSGSGLTRDVSAVRAAGSVSVLADVQTPSGRVRARAGTARIGGDRAVPYNAEFRIGSATKTFISTTLLQLVGEGRLSLDDPIARWLPGLIHGNGNDGEKITVREVLQHTSGIYNYADDPQLATAVSTAANYRRNRFHSYRPEELVAIAMRHRPQFAPGTHWSYSDTNYIIAGMIIRRVTGHSWAQEVRRRIVDPLHLRHTYAPGDDPYLIGPHAHGYAAFPDAPGLTDVTVFNMSDSDASGSMVSSAADQNTFWRALLAGRLLKPAQLRQMQTTVAVPADFGVPPGTRYGLGMFRFPLSCGGHYWGHPGDAPGFQTVNGVRPDGRESVVAVMTGPETTAMQLAALSLVDHALCSTNR